MGAILQLLNSSPAVPLALTLALDTSRGTDCVRKNTSEYCLSMNANESVSPKFQHVTITFPPGQEARVRSFYAGALGLREKPIPKVVKPLGWIWFDTGSAGLELHCVPDAQIVPADTRHHFCLEVDDLDRQRKSLGEWGAKIVEARALPLRPRFFARDPFNNLIEFVKIEGDYLANGD
jgi:catechol 2,3-dioxygenase-like lactoylglutathione lyase family enzyme